MGFNSSCKFPETFCLFSLHDRKKVDLRLQITTVVNSMTAYMGDEVLWVVHRRCFLTSFNCFEESTSSRGLGGDPARRDYWKYTARQDSSASDNKKRLI